MSGRRRIFFVILIAGLFLTISSGKYFFASLKKPVDIMEVSAEEIKKGARVETELYVAMDSFASEETWREENGRKTGSHTSKCFYIIPVGDQEYMALEGTKSQIQTLDAICDETLSYLLGEVEYVGENTLRYEGYVTAMDDELEQYYYEWFTDNDWFASEEELNQYVLPYMVEHVDFRNSQILFGIGAALLLVDAVFVVLYLRKRQKPAESTEYPGVML